MMAKFNAQDYAQFKKILLDLRARLTDEIDHIKDDTLNKSNRDSSGDLSGYSLHMADQASDNYDREFLLNLASNGQDVLYRIDEALKRIEEKSFGICQACEKSITKARLKVVPFAEHCVKCQELEEKNKGSRQVGN